MKRILVLPLLLAAGFSAAAQTTTNLDWRIREIKLVNGTPILTNTSNFTWDYTVKKEALRIDGLALAFATYVANGGTSSFDQWLKQDVIDRAKEYAKVKQAADNAVLLSKINYLLTDGIELLLPGDLSSLNTIAAKAP